ncbi:rhodanese-like domain-containing protein [Cytobacillus spongiae]|jgi:rhodanese-related sulfurtransferase|uniref:rhodanese-like domain-containing protein n=1 Tax=Cytobacillus spongiae TaxID=2901381 RepID=UPI001F30D781|nr:rhodanese-like domain-containing protein [Cytobacillus spongiae]UII54454.1 rhodanese-like domain-containing protein [Cytobacillus spongiae]
MKNMTTTEVLNAIQNGEAIHIVDVREVDEVSAGKIPGAFHIPLGLLEFRMHELDKNTEYTIACRSGARSSRATQFLEYQGYKVTNMEGGMMSWNGPVE